MEKQKCKQTALFVYVFRKYFVPRFGRKQNHLGIKHCGLFTFLFFHIWNVFVHILQLYIVGVD